MRGKVAIHPQDQQHLPLHTPHPTPILLQLCLIAPESPPHLLKPGLKPSVHYMSMRPNSMPTFLDRLLSPQFLPTALLALASVAIASPLLAATPVATPLLAQQFNCNDAQTQSAMNICAEQSYENADRALNRTYQALLPNLSATRRQKLTDAQLKWIKFRDAECDFYGSEAEGGTMQPMLVSGCQDQLTQQRTVDFNAYLAGKSSASGSNYSSADRRLNQLYQRLRQKLDPNRNRKLETAELAWIAFRDSACGFESSSGGNAARNQCLTRLTNQRNQQLQGYLAIDH